MNGPSEGELEAVKKKKGSINASSPILYAMKPRVRTIPMIIFSILLVLLNEAQVLLKYGFDEQTSFIFIQVSLLFYFLLFWIITGLEHTKLDKAGFTKINQKGAQLVSLLFIVSSMEVSLVEAVFSIINLNRLAIMQGIVSISNFLCLVLLLRYLGLCYHFNGSRPSEERVSYEAQLQSQRDEIAMLRTEVEKHLMNNRLRVGADTLAQLSGANQEIRLLKAETERLRREMVQVDEALDVSRKTGELLRKDNKDELEQISELKKKLRTLTKDNEHLHILIEVQKESNAGAQKALEELSRGL